MMKNLLFLKEEKIISFFDAFFRINLGLKIFCILNCSMSSKKSNIKLPKNIGSKF
jgi:hypothetical protein